MSQEAVVEVNGDLSDPGPEKREETQDKSGEPLDNVICSDRFCSHYSIKHIERSELVQNSLMVCARDLQYYCTRLH